MSLPAVIADTFAARLPQARDVRVVRGRELHCRLGAADVAPLARLLIRELRADLRLMVGADRRAQSGTFEIHYLFARPGEDWFVHATVAVDAADPAIPSLATLHYPASRFEREIADLFGIRALGHPDPRPLVRHAFWPADWFPLRKDAPAREFQDDGQPFPFQQVGGEGVYEIPVGPVHAGIIEPGHFRFSVDGETVVNLETRMGFVHKGTEKLFETLPFERGPALAERV